MQTEKKSDRSIIELAEIRLRHRFESIKWTDVTRSMYCCWSGDRKLWLFLETSSNLFTKTKTWPCKPRKRNTSRRCPNMTISSLLMFFKPDIPHHYSTERNQVILILQKILCLNDTKSQIVSKWINNSINRERKDVTSLFAHNTDTTEI